MTENLIIKEVIRIIVILWGIGNIFCLFGFWNNKKSIDDGIRAIQLVAINSIFIVLMFIYFVVTVIIL